MHHQRDATVRMFPSKWDYSVIYIFILLEVGDEAIAAYSEVSNKRANGIKEQGSILSRFK